MRWEWFVAALLALLVLCNAVMTWALWPDGCPTGEPKYRLQDFRKVPPTQPENLYGHEPRQWEFRCIGGEKDCGPARPIPEPGTLLLVGPGLMLLALRTTKNPPCGGLRCRGRDGG